MHCMCVSCRLRVFACRATSICQTCSLLILGWLCYYMTLSLKPSQDVHKLFSLFFPLLCSPSSRLLLKFVDVSRYIASL